MVLPLTSLGRSPFSLLNCFDKLEVAEFTAKTLISTKNIGEAIKISDEEVEAINVAFNLN